MRYLLILLLPFSMSANAIPIKWTSADECFALGEVICGSFLFDLDTGDYGNIDLMYTYNIGGYKNSHQFSGFFGGNQYQLHMKDNFPNEPHSVDLRLTDYDLSALVQQPFNWQYAFGPAELNEGSSELIPGFEPLPISIPATIPLLGLGLAFLGFSRRKHQQNI